MRRKRRFFVLICCMVLSLALEVFLQKVIYVESQVKTKKSNVPAFQFPSVMTMGKPRTGLTEDAVHQFQQVLNTDREEVPSSFQNVHDDYMSYIAACLSIQRRFLPLLLKEKDVLLNLYQVLLNCDACGVFSPVSVIALPNRSMMDIANALKGILCVCGHFPLLDACIAEFKAKAAAASTSESVFLSSTLF